MILCAFVGSSDLYIEKIIHFPSVYMYIVCYTYGIEKHIYFTYMYNMYKYIHRV